MSAKRCPPGFDRVGGMFSAAIDPCNAGESVAGMTFREKATCLSQGMSLHCILMPE